MSNVPKLRFSEYEEEWFDTSIGGSCSLKAGKFVRSSEILEQPSDTSYPCYGGNGLRGFVNSHTHDGTFSLIGRQGALCGNVQFVSGKFHATEHAVVVTPSTDNDSKWLFYLLGKLDLNRYATGQAQPGLSVDVLNAVPFSAPRIEEQQKIADFLTAVDTKIEQLTRKEELLKQYKKGVMQKIFSQEIRFKADDGSEFPEWVEQKLSEVTAKKSSTLVASSFEENNGTYPVYGATGLIKLIDFYTEEEPYISIVKDGAGVGRVLLCAEKSTVLGTLDIIKNKSGINLYFILMLLEQIDFTKYVTGSTIPHIYYRDYSSEKVYVPTLAEQNKIASFIAAIDDKVRQVVTQRDTAKTFKKGLLEQMFV